VQGKLGNNQPQDILFFSAALGLQPHRDGKKAIPLFSIHKEQAVKPFAPVFLLCISK